MSIKATITQINPPEVKPDHYVKIGKTYASPLFSDLQVFNEVYKSQSLLDWKRALDWARDAYNPRFYELMNLFDDIKIDAQVLSVVQKRAIGVTNKRVMFIKRDGTEDENIRLMVTQTPWFQKLLNFKQESRFFGYGLAEFTFDTDGAIKDIIEIKRSHTLPTSGLVLKFPSDLEGYSYVDDPLIRARTIPCGKPDYIGLYLSMAYWVIYKRGGVNDLARYGEMFAAPYRVAKYNPYAPDQRQLLNSAMAGMGARGYVVIPDGTSLEFINNNGSAAVTVYDSITDLCDDQISKVGLGGTMTLNEASTKGGSEVHERGEDDIILSDIIDTEYWLNWELRERLIKLGYPVQEGTFKFDLSKQLTVPAIGDFLAKVVPLGLKVPASWVYKIANIPAPKDGEEVLEMSDAAIDPSNLPNSNDTRKLNNTAKKLSGGSKDQPKK